MLVHLLLELCKRPVVFEHGDDLCTLSSLSHYNPITEPCARFLLSLLEHLTIDFPSHFIVSLIDVFQDSASRDKLIFPSTIVRILHHFSVPLPASNLFTFMCAIDAATIKRSEAQFRSQQQDFAPPSRSTPSHSARSTSASPFSGRCDSWRHHGAAAAHGCSPRYTLHKVVSDEYPCWRHC